MTAETETETDVRIGDSEVSKVDIEEKISSNLNSCEDLEKVGGECNGIVHYGVEDIDGNVKDDGDGSYVFVSGPDAVSDDFGEKDLDAERAADPAETLEIVPAVEGEAVSEPNVYSQSWEKQVEVGELRVEKVGNDQSPIENGCNIDDSVVSSPTNGAAVENSHSQPKGNEVEKNDTTNEQNKTTLSPEVDVSQESIITITEAAESEVPLLDRDGVKQNVTVPLAEVESDEMEESQVSITVMDAVECELQLLDNEEKVEEVASVKETEERSRLESATEVKENQESENTIKDSAESMGHKLHDGKGEVGEARELDLAIKEQNQESQVTDTKDVELELDQLDNIEEKDPEDNPSGDIRLEAATSPVNTQLEAEAPDGSVESETSLSSGPIASETEVINGLSVGNKAAKSEVPLLDCDEVKQNVTVPLADVEFDDVEEGRVSITVEEALECEFQQLDNEEKVEEVDCVRETEEQSILDSATEVKENQEAENTVDSAESKGHWLYDGEEEAEEARKLDLAEKEENQESQDTDMKDVDLELGQLDNKEQKDPEDNPSQGMGLEAATVPVNTQLEAEAIDGSIESGTSLSSGPVASETEVTNDLSVENGNMMSAADIKLESENVDGSSENPASLPHLVDEVERETVVGNISVEHGESLPTDPMDNMISEAEVRNPVVEISENLPLAGTKLETVIANGSTDGVESRHTCIAGNGKSENEISNGSVEDDIAVPECPAANLEIESGAMNGSAASARSLPNCSVNDAEVESEVLNCSIEKNCSIENGSRLPTCHVPDVEQEPEARIGSGASGNAPSVDTVNFVAIVQDGSVENGGCGTEAHSVRDIIDVENEGMQSASGDSNGKPICQQVDTEAIQGDEGLQSSPECSTADAVDEKKVDAEVVKKPFHFVIKIPRFVDDKHKLKEEIRHAQLQVEEKTQSRDAVRATIQMKRETCNEYRDKFEAAKSEERISRDALSAKRQEIDSVQSAISIDDIDEKIHNMEHMIQHETMPLKEEKQLIREIKQLKLLREQLSSHMGRQDEHQQGSDHRERSEERFKLLKQELDSLRKKVSQTEGITKAAKEKYFDENEKLRKLQSQFKAADDLRQEAYAHLQNLRKELFEKNKYFRMYKDELIAAHDYASVGDREALQRLCVNQVETVMELWNKNDEFRKEYIRCNTMSTLRRLTTLDGRSLGPGEERPVIHSVVDERVDNATAAASQIHSALVVSPSEPEQSLVPRRAEKGDVKSVVRVQQENSAVKLKKASKPTALENGSTTSSGREEKDEMKEENKKSKEEEELARKAEELRKEEAAARLKVQRRLEEKAKAKEAEDRKRRNAEKAQAKAELRAQREAELKEKEREKRARKKERKKAAVAEGANVDIEGESAPSNENTPSEITDREPEITEKTTPVLKRPQKPSQLTKQSKTKPLPPPLRNRGKRRMQTWVWLFIVALLVLALFFLGSIGIPFKFGLPSFGF